MEYQITNYIDHLPKTTNLFRKVSDSLLLPRIIQLETNLYVACFSIMKLLPAKHILAKAFSRGDIQENCIIVDTSSGTFALGVGIICAELGLPFRIFGDPAIDTTLIQQLEHLGGSVHISLNPAYGGGYQRLRLQALQQFINQKTPTFWMNQYDNQDGAEAYSIVGELILQLLGTDINMVGTVGSGGSTCGIIKTMRKVNSSVELIGVDTFNSVLFGHADGERLLRGLGNSIVPKNLDHTCFDEVHWVCANDAIHHTRWLFQTKSIFCGPTSGAAYQVASYLAHKNKNKKYIFISADEGHRYLSTVYNNTWLKSQSFYYDDLVHYPLEVENPLTAQKPWSYMRWNRKSYLQILGG